MRAHKPGIMTLLQASVFRFGRRHDQTSSLALTRFLTLLLNAALTVPLHAAQTPTTTPSTPVIVEIELNDIVHPVSADYIQAGLKHAQEVNARAVILRIDTPGGLI